MSYPDGAVSRITNDLTEYGATSFSLTADDSTIATLTSDDSSKIWLATPGDFQGRPRRLTNGKHDGQNGIDWTPDGRIVYIARDGPARDIWIVNADGAGQKQLTQNDHIEADLRVSADGRTVVFVSAPPGGLQHLWRIEIDGSNLKQLTDGNFVDFFPFWSPDGQWIFFSSWRTGSARLWKMPAAGGAAEQVTDLPFTGQRFAGSKLIFGAYFDEQGNPARWRYALVDAETRQVVKTFDSTAGADWFGMLDERTLVYAQTKEDIGNIWIRSLDGGEPKQLTNFDSDRIYFYAASRDGKQFAVSRGVSNANIILIKDFR